MSEDEVRSEHLYIRPVPGTEQWRVSAHSECGAYLPHSPEWMNELWQQVCLGGTLVVLSQTESPTGNMFDLDFGAGVVPSVEECRAFLLLLEPDCQFWELGFVEDEED